MLNVQTLNDALNAAGLSTVKNVDDVSVECMLSPNGKAVPNQYVVTVNDNENYFRIFQSYKTLIAVRTQDKIVLDSGALDYSNTTLKYLKSFLKTSDSKKQLNERIELGEFLTVNLNNK